VYLWLKTLHIAAMAIWFTGLFFLPRLFVARQRNEPDGENGHFFPMANAVYFRVMTPAGVVTIALGMILVVYGPHGAWLAMKLAVVALAVLIHLYFGVVLHAFAQGQPRHSVAFFQAVGWLPLVLLLALAGITARKPATVEPLPPVPEARDSALPRMGP
jgi:putative membrane protein